MRRWVRIVVGLVLLWGALGVLGYRMGWTSHLRRGESALLRHAAASGPSGAPCGAASPEPAVKTGQLAGVLTIPTLHVVAPVAQGTSDAVLDAAVGHAPSTPMPATPGTAVLLAHDVSYFSDIDALKPGDVLRYSWGCSTAAFRVTGHRVVHAGDPVPAEPGDGLVLDTCWPTDALWYTPDRLLVEAVRTAVGPAPVATADHEPRWPSNYTTGAPPSLVAQGLDLAHNETPMGTLQLTGSPDRAWEQSPAPLAVQDAALAAYFGALRSLAQERADFWRALAPGVAMPKVLSGVRVAAHDAPLDVRITAQGAVPRAVTLSTVVTLAGGGEPGRHHLQVTEAVRGLRIVITSWEVHHA